MASIKCCNSRCRISLHNYLHLHQEDSIDAELVETVQDAIHQLPDRRKTIFILSRDEGLTYEEIAEALDISVKTQWEDRLVDVNGIGHLDLLITSLTDENFLYMNDGSGHIKLKEYQGRTQHNRSKSGTKKGAENNRNAIGSSIRIVY